MAADRDYILGTHDDELNRLGIQHRVWRPTVQEAWRRAGIRPGSHVLDVGAGPGYATLDLAELVGPTGSITAFERSTRFAAAGRHACQQRGHTHVRYHELDLMTDPWPAVTVDAAWCRWVAAFVSSPQLLVERLNKAIRPGGVAIFHEYSHYASWRLAPRRPIFEEFVDHVITNWRQSGGEPDIALDLPHLLAHAGFRLREATPRVFCLRRDDPMWQWPASFIAVHPQRLLELGKVTSNWVNDLHATFAASEADPHTLMITPTVLEIIAER
jgi:ubiquinone/menaquinone biosynthesis C-methylase UbiE